MNRIFLQSVQVRKLERIYFSAINNKIVTTLLKLGAKCNESVVKLVNTVPAWNHFGN